MITYFSDQESRNIKIQKVDSRPLPEFYLSEREKVWQQKYEESRRLGTSLWNGEVYTLDRILQGSDEHIILKLGTCEYKDILFQIHKRNQNIKDPTYEPEIPYLTVCCIPITTDNRFVFGIRSGQTAVQKGALSLIGGTLNKDEKEIHEFEDVFSFMRQEIAEETAIDPHFLQMNLFSLNFFRMKYEFLFTFNLTLHSEEIASLHKEGEFSQLTAMSLDEVFKTELPQTDSFRNTRNYLHTLLNKFSIN